MAKYVWVPVDVIDRDGEKGSDGVRTKRKDVDLSEYQTRIPFYLSTRP